MRATPPDGVGARSPQATRVPGSTNQLVPSRHVVRSTPRVTCRDAATVSPSPPEDMPYIVCAIPCPYFLPARWTLPLPRASLPINGLDEPRKIAQRVASGMWRCSPECFAPEHCGPSAPRHAELTRLPSAVTSIGSKKHSSDFSPVFGGWFCVCSRRIYEVTTAWPRGPAAPR